MSGVGAASLLTRGQRPAVAAVRRMVATSAPHAVLLVGPQSTGKTTLALDLAAGLLCQAGDPSDRPCRSCRSCRQVESGNHPDVHRLAPEGAGGQIRIGTASHPEPGTVRHLIGELSLLPVEGGARVAVVEAAHRMNEDAQNTLLKTLEEPPSGVTIILCADEEDRLLPTVRSRCARLRLGPLGSRDIEDLLTERDVADAPHAARLARLAGGRPGIALAYAAAPEAVRIREELARSLIDLLGANRHGRLTAIRQLQAHGAALVEALAAATPQAPAPQTFRSSARRVSGRAAAATTIRTVEGASIAGTPDSTTAATDATAVSTDAAPPEPADASATPPGRLAPQDRRRAALTLLEVWRFLAVDLALAARGGRRELRDPALLDELTIAAERIPGGSADAFLIRLDRIAQLVEQYVNPELALDVLALAWPHVR